MARLTCSAVWNVLPRRWAVASAAAGLVACMGSLLVGLALTALVVWAIPPAVPHPTEAYEGIGDALMAQLCFGIGAALSLSMALVIGIVVGQWVASRR
jgi:uncharacterized membrane protein